MTDINLWRRLYYQVDQNTHICWTEHTLLLDRVGDKLIFLLLDSSFSNIHASNFHSVKEFLPWMYSGCSFLLLTGRVPFDFQNLLINLVGCILSLHFSGTYFTEFPCTDGNFLVLYLPQPPSTGGERVWKIRKKEKSVGENMWMPFCLKHSTQTDIHNDDLTASKTISVYSVKAYKDFYPQTVKINMFATPRFKL